MEDDQQGDGSDIDSANTGTADYEGGDEWDDSGENEDAGGDNVEGDDFSGDGAGDDTAGDDHQNDSYDDGIDSSGDDAESWYADDEPHGAGIAQEQAGDEGADYQDAVATQDSTDETGYAADTPDGDGTMAMQADALPGTDGAEPQRARVLTFRAICSTGHDEWVGSKQTSPNQAYTDAGWHDSSHHHSKPTARVQQFDPQDPNGWTDHKLAE